MDILSSSELKALYQHRVKNLDEQQLLPVHIENAMSNLTSREGIEANVIGHSFMGQAVNCLSIGSGPTRVLMWTQMHGDESTATSAVLDIVHLLSDHNCQDSLHSILNPDWQKQITLHIVPMLNPDGAILGTRENAQGIDINRDALSLQSPEGRILHNLVSDIQPHFAFNLHDQHDYYRCGDTGKSSTLAFLAPAFDAQKTINASRCKAMALIALMQTHATHLLPQGIARYDDEFSVRSFGDQIAKRDVSTILIESGHYPDDRHRQIARTMNVFSMLHALDALCETGEWQTEAQLAALESRYWQIPDNREYQLCDLLIKELGFKQSGSANCLHTVDIAIRKHSRFKRDLLVADIGDLHEQHGLNTFDATGYVYDPGHPYLLNKKLCLNSQTYLNLLQQGFSHFVGKVTFIDNQSDYIVIHNPQIWHDEQRMAKGIPPAGFLCQDGERKFAIVMAGLIAL